MVKKKSVKKRKKVSKKKKTTKKVVNKPRISSQSVEIKMQPILVDNFVALQKVMVNLADKLGNVSTKIEKLLDLFEISAKTLAKKDFKLTGEKNPEVLEKLGELSEQNKIIARGLTLIHETAPTPIPIPTPKSIPGPIPTPQPVPIPTPTPESIKTPALKTEEYKKSTPFKPLNLKTSK